MRNGFNGLAAKVQTMLKDDPMSGHVFIFRGRSGSKVKLLWSTGDGLCLLTKRLERGRFAWPSARIMGVGLNTIFRHFKKLRPQSVTSRIQPGSDVIVCAEMDEQWGYVGAKSRQRWLFYAYDRLRKTVVAHVFGERTMATLGRLMSLLSPFDVVIWMTDGWPLYEPRLKGKLHVISKRYTQRIERHNLNLRQHLARLGRKSLSFSKSVELHDKVIGHYLNIKHYQ
ncbi:IS1 family transposase [Hafnia paralvei]|uniref:IS1 family transposase n=1 Tax=Hafnia paralvei TaxID=546367 RepID=A0A2A2M717_9GAMM|nr:IS1 family transposase [Hafnia paralvei]PNK70644.1 IS1 family transposase [Hafnia paralvei]